MEERRREPQLQYHDEISLVDLAATFLKRRRVFYAVVLAALLAGIVYAVLIPERYDYVSLVKLAEKSPGNYIDNPAAIIATLENRWLPEYQSTYFAEHDRSVPFKVHFDNPESTGLIRLVSEASPSQRDGVKQAHTQLIDELADAQSAAVSSLKQNLERQIESLSSTITMLEDSTDAGVAIAATVEKRLSLEATLNSMQPMEILAVSREGTERKGPARSLVVLLAGLLGLMGGIFLAFFTEFAGLVKAQLAEM
ncbi:Wzz/FepE/Etk N-terminal domain-containing protein [Marinobacter sp.]|uniref:Wzz/FepE/Etk N-terminal domain-containing protein n=1 Tax=Marinobacter sp. TaxID=50741 RepID=UPI003A8ED699